MLPEVNLLKNFESVRAAIAEGARQSGRSVQDIKLLAVSKNFPADFVRRAFDECAQVAFAENYVQEALAKKSALADLPIEWHFIGHLQSNKVKHIADQFHLIHAVDRLSIARALSEKSQAKQTILIEVNLANEGTKSGCVVGDLPALLGDIQQLQRVQLAGLMFMPPLDLSPKEQRQYFARARELRDSMTKYLQTGHDLKQLSMGTSHDFQSAIAEGATIVRLGTSLFGPRKN